MNLFTIRTMLLLYGSPTVRKISDERRQPIHNRGVSFVKNELAYVESDSIHDIAEHIRSVEKELSSVQGEDEANEEPSNQEEPKKEVVEP